MTTSSCTAHTIQDIQLALAGTLPGATAQLRMAPAPVDGQSDRWKMPDDCREAGVLLLFYPHAVNGHAPGLHFALTQRHEYVGAHSGQISFPGGRREKGESIQGTALRETKEEIGVTPEEVDVIGKLSSLYTPPSNFCIYPFVAYSPTRPSFRLDPREVAELIEVPLGLFVNPRIQKQETWHFERYGTRLVPFFEIFGHKVWGATAMILSEFLTLMSNHSAQT